MFNIRSYSRLGLSLILMSSPALANSHSLKKEYHPSSRAAQTETPTNHSGKENGVGLHAHLEKLQQKYGSLSKREVSKVQDRARRILMPFQTANLSGYQFQSADDLWSHLQHKAKFLPYLKNIDLTKTNIDDGSLKYAVESMLELKQSKYSDHRAIYYALRRAQYRLPETISNYFLKDLLDNGFRIDVEKIDLYGMKDRTIKVILLNHLLSPNLKHLSVAGARLTDDTVRLISQSFPNLISLNLEQNTSLTDLSLIYMSQLAKLENVRVLRTGFVNRLNGFQNLSKLNRENLLEAISELHLNSEVVNDVLIRQIVKDIPNLNNLTVGPRCNISPNSLTELSGLKKLYKVGFDHNFSITDDHLGRLSKIRSLENVSLYRAMGISADGLLKLKQLPNLRFLDASHSGADLDILELIDRLRREFSHIEMFILNEADYSSDSDAGSESE